MQSIRVYGADWCEDTRHTLQHLDALGVPYQYINIDRDESGRGWVLAHNGGRQKTPTVDVDGQILSVPRDSQLDKVLRRSPGV